jgi:hypothetical protein
LRNADLEEIPMRKQLLLSTGIICLMLAPAVSFGQAPAGRGEDQKQMRPNESGRGAAAQERGTERAQERAPAAEQRTQGREERGAGSRQSEERGKAGSSERPSTASDDSKRGRGDDAKPNERAQDTRSGNRDAQTAREGRDAKDSTKDSKGNAEMKRDNERSRAESERSKDSSTAAQKEREGASTQKDAGREQRDGAKNAAEQQGRDSSRDANRPSTTTDTTRTPPASNAQNAPAGAASQTQASQQTNISVEKQTRISQTMTRERLAPPERNLNVSIRIGDRAPDRIRYHRLPDTIVTIEPEYRGYDYFTTDDDIVIVEPGTRRIVSQVPRDASRIYAADSRGGGAYPSSGSYPPSGTSSTSGTATSAGASGAMAAAEAQCRVMRRDTAGNLTEVTPQTVGSTAQQPDTIAVTVRLPGGATTAPIPLGAPDGQIVVSAQSGADCVVTLEPQTR